MRFKKPDTCPECDSNDVRFIIRGLPSEQGWQMIKNNEAVAGGFILFEDLPMWKCAECCHELSDETDPAVIVHRRLEQRLFGNMDLDFRC